MTGPEPGHQADPVPAKADPRRIKLRLHQKLRLGEMMKRAEDLDPFEKGLVKGCMSRLSKGHDLTEKQVERINASLMRLKMGRMSAGHRQEADKLANEITMACRAGVFPTSVRYEMQHAAACLRRGKKLTDREAGLWGGYKAQSAVRDFKPEAKPEAKPKPKPQDKPNVDFARMAQQVEAALLTGHLDKVRKVMVDAVSRLKSGEHMTPRQRSIMSRYNSLKKRGFR